MARKLVERNGIGETADAVWKALNTEHQNLFPTISGCGGDAASPEPPVVSLGTQYDPVGLVEGTIDTGPIIVFGRRPESLSGKRRRGRPVVPEQASLFSLK
jgi:hypothetical protein